MGDHASITKKTCTKCLKCKPATPEFFTRNGGNRIRSTCRLCTAQAQREWVARNPEKSRANEDRKYQKKLDAGYYHSERAKESRKKSKLKRREQDPDFYKKAQESWQRWVTKNRESLLTVRAERYKARRVSDPVFIISQRIRTRLRHAISRRGMVKSLSSQEVFGCSPKYLAAHIEAQFTDGMSWERLGEIHIDHIIPLATASSIEDIIRLNHYTNLQPLWAEDNLRKGSKV